MAKENPLLTIKEFAAAAGVSKQNIYSQLETRLASYLVEVDGVKMLKKSALKRFYPEEFEQLDSQVDSQVVQPKKKEKEDDKMLGLLGNQLEILSKQLETKDRQIEELNKRLAEITILLDQQQKLSLIDKQSEDTKEVTEVNDEEIQQSKKGLFGKLFGK